MIAFKLLNKKYILSALSVLSVLCIFAAPVSAQYIRDFKKEAQPDTAQPSGGPSAPVYSPYVRNQQQQDHQATPEISANNPIYDEYRTGNTLLQNFIETSQRQGQDRNAVNARAPSAQDLPSIHALPDDPVKYCTDYEEKNPGGFFSKTQSETLLSERIKPVEQMNFNLAKTCLGKVRDIAEKMLVDYSEFKRNELLLRGQKDANKFQALAKKANELSQANVNYSTYARSECSLVNSAAAEHPFDAIEMTDACVIRMLKQRIQQVASM